MDEKTYKDEFAMLEELEIELDPRMSEVERWEADILCRRARRLKPADIKDYFIFLNRLAHSKGLIMKDRDMLPGVVRNTR